MKTSTKVDVLEARASYLRGMIAMRGAEGRAYRMFKKELIALEYVLPGLRAEAGLPPQIEESSPRASSALRLRDIKATRAREQALGSVIEAEEDRHP